MAENTEAVVPSVEGATRPSRRRFLVVGLIAGLVVALCAAGTFGFLYLSNLEPEAADVKSFMEAEGKAVTNRSIEITNLLMNYDATNIDQVAERMGDLATGNFKEEYEKLIGGGLTSALQKASASSRGRITEGPDIAFRSPSEAIALLGVTQTTQSNENPTGQTIDYVMKITLVDTADEGWKADRVEVLSERRS